MHVLFANTGVQVVCIPLRGGSRYQTNQIGYGWQRCAMRRRGRQRSPADLPLHPVADHPVGHDAAVPGRRHLLRRPGSRLLLLAHLADPRLPRQSARAAGHRGQAAEGRAATSSSASAPRRPRPATPSTSTWSSTSATAAPACCCWNWPAKSARRRRCSPSSSPTATTSTPGTRKASSSAMPAARWFSSKTHWCNTPYLPPLEQKKIDYHTVGEEDGKRGWFGRGGKSRQAKVEMVVTPPLVRRPLHGPHGPRGRRRGAGHAGRRRHPHRRELAQALPLGRRRELAGRGQLAHGRSRRPLQDRRLRLAAEGSLPQVHPRGRPRLPPAGQRAQGERVRRRGPAQAAARAPRADDRRALRDALPGLHLRQLDRLPQRLRRGGPGPRNPHAHAQLSQRHDPGGAAAA